MDSSPLLERLAAHRTLSGVPRDQLAWLVWSNLVDNAIDATPGGHVRIEATADAEHVLVRVIDDGPGIAEAIVNRIFDPFFTTKDVGDDRPH